MSTGVAVADECLSVYQDLKLKKSIAYIVYKLSSDNSIIEVERTATGASYDEFVQSLPLDDCRYAVFDFQFEKAGEGQRSKICFYVWAPDTAKIKQKMLYAASKDAIRKKLVGIASEIQCTDLSEVSYDAVLERVAGPGR